MQYLISGLLLCLSAVVWSQSLSDLYSITADDIQSNAESGVTTYRGNAEVIVANMIIQADEIAITAPGGIPSKIEATGSPIKFHEQVPDKNIQGTAREVSFDVAELRLTVIEYSITDPAGNNMKGKKISFILTP